MGWVWGNMKTTVGALIRDGVVDGWCGLLGDVAAARGLVSFALLLAGRHEMGCGSFGAYSFTGR